MERFAWNYWWQWFLPFSTSSKSYFHQRKQYSWGYCCRFPVSGHSYGLLVWRHSRDFHNCCPGRAYGVKAISSMYPPLVIIFPTVRVNCLYLNGISDILAVVIQRRGRGFNVGYPYMQKLSVLINADGLYKITLWRISSITRFLRAKKSSVCLKFQYLLVISLN